MNVFVVTKFYYDDTEVLAVYDTEDSARLAQKTFEQNERKNKGKYYAEVITVPYYESSK